MHIKSTGKGQKCREGLGTRPVDMARVGTCVLKVREKTTATLEGRQGSIMVDIPLPPTK